RLVCKLGPGGDGGLPAGGVGAGGGAGRPKNGPLPAGGGPPRAGFWVGSPPGGAPGAPPFRRGQLFWWGRFFCRSGVSPPLPPATNSAHPPPGPFGRPAAPSLHQNPPQP